MDELLNAVEKEKNNRFQKQWTKLDKGTKLNRITLFIEEQSKINELDEDEIKLLKKLLFRLCQNGSFNKSGEIDYSEETYQIINIKNLKYDKNKKKYSFDLPKKTIKPSSKSKSNIDRHFSRSKDNKK
tara:strand:- start:89 stop:472 length:384 start_codon:yes stop_codon:yes gene_type:complete